MENPRASLPTTNDEEMASPTENNNSINDYYLSLERRLEKLEVRLLEGDNQKLKEKMEEFQTTLQEKQARLEFLEEEVKSSELDVAVLRMQLRWEKEKNKEQEKGWGETKSFLGQLFGVAKGVLEGLGGSAPPQIESVEEEKMAETLENFCGDLRSKFKEWRENHQTMHNELVKTLTVVEGLAEQFDDNGDKATGAFPCPTSSVTTSHQAVSLPSAPASIFSTTSSFRPPYPILPFFDDDLLPPRQNHFRSCTEAIDSYCETGSTFSEQPSAYSHSAFGCEDCENTFCRLAHAGSKLARVVKKKEEAEAGQFKIPSAPASELRRTSRTPKPTKRKLEAEKAVVPQKTGKGFKCGLCVSRFITQAFLEEHLKAVHRIDFNGEGFSCLECSKSFVGTMSEVITHRSLFHHDKDDDDASFFSTLG